MKLERLKGVTMLSTRYMSPRRQTVAHRARVVRWLMVSVVVLATGSFTSTGRSASVLDSTPNSPAMVESVSTTDLEIDPAFGGNDTGEAIFDFNVGDSRHDEGLRTFFRCEASAGDVCTQPFYYVVGRRANAFGWDAVVAKADTSGNPDFAFGVQGRLVVSTPLIDLYDVAFDSERGRLYFAGGGYSSAFPREGFAVYCVDIVSGAACADWNYRFIAFEISIDGVIDSVASRIAFDSSGFLFVGGRVQADGGFQLGVAKIEAASGSTVNGFGNTGRATYPFQVPGVPPPPVQDARVLDMALSASSAPQGAVLYLVGSNVASSGLSHGYIVGIDPQGGAYLKGRDVFGSAATAVAILADGNIATVGYVASGTPDAPSLVLAKVHAADASLDPDTRSCGTGFCVHEVGAGVHGWQDTLPTSIAERPGNHDVVVAMQAKVWTYDFANDLWHVNQKEVVQQFGATGTTLHATQKLDFPTSADDVPTAYSGAMIVEKGSLLVTGTRLWALSTNDYDVTVTRLLANDAIFADAFDGADAD
jgi:hypothetical protein